MKLGDIIRFKKTGVVGTIVEVFGSGNGVAKVMAHNVEKVIPNPNVFSTSHLEKVAEIISPS